MRGGDGQGLHTATGYASHVEAAAGRRGATVVKGEGMGGADRSESDQLVASDECASSAQIALAVSLKGIFALLGGEERSAAIATGWQPIDKRTGKRLSTHIHHPNLCATHTEGKGLGAGLSDLKARCCPIDNVLMDGNASMRTITLSLCPKKALCPTSQTN